MKNTIKNTSHLLIAILLICGLYACVAVKSAATYDFPKPIDTTDKEIIYQEKKTYTFADIGVYVSNEFDGARLNGCRVMNDSTIEATISPENTPINASAYYAMQIWSDEARDLTVILNYTEHAHRYSPKISTNRSDWTILDSTQVEVLNEGKQCAVTLTVSPKKTYLSGQELVVTSDVKMWCEDKAEQSGVAFSSIGKSKLGRDLFCLDICTATKKEKDLIVIMSRQHPPEVTGYLAMEAFVEEVLEDKPLSRAFREKYRVLVFPLMNPDGVDLGHWRHSAGGIDMNRDWAYYHQPETKAVADFVVQTEKADKNDVILGLDFHSTWYDVYYTMVDSLHSDLPGFRHYWIPGVQETLNDYEAKDKPAGLGAPVSKGWFYTQFNAEGITYEIGDETPREFIDLKGRVSAREMMQLLVFR